MNTSRASRVLALGAALVMAVTGLLAIGPAAAAAPAKKDITLTLTTLPAQVRLLAGESIKVTLSTNVTTGYSWSTKVTFAKSAVTVSKGAYTAPSTDLVGAPGTTTWIITAKKTGVAVVKFLTTPPGGGATTSVGAVTIYAGNAVTLD